MKAIGRGSDILTVAAFAIALGLMAVFSLAGSPDPRSFARENRAPSAAPSVPKDLHALKKVPSQVDAYFNDRLAFRETMLDLNAQVRAELGVPVADNVICGKDRWLFQNFAKSENVGREPRDQTEQFESWSAALTSRHEWLKTRGIEYLIVITPEKQSVQTEFLPDGPPPIESFAVDQIRSWLKTQPIRSLDLLPALRLAKAGGPLYFRTDTHWMDDGAYVAYRELVCELSKRWPDMKPLDRAAFKVESREHQGDLARMMRMDAMESNEYLTLRDPKAHRMDQDVGLDPKLHSPNSVEPQVWGTGEHQKPRCVLFHDSFAERLLRPVLAEHFDFVVYAPTASFDRNVVERFRPQIVIQQIVERKFNWHAPDPHANGRQD
jgi:hypothetical protein